MARVKLLPVEVSAVDPHGAVPLVVRGGRLGLPRLGGLVVAQALEAAGGVVRLGGVAAGVAGAVLVVDPHLRLAGVGPLVEEGDIAVLEDRVTRLRAVQGDVCGVSEGVEGHVCCGPSRRSSWGAARQWSLPRGRPGRLTFRIGAGPPQTAGTPSGRRWNPDATCRSDAGQSVISTWRALTACRLGCDLARPLEKGGK